MPDFSIEDGLDLPTGATIVGIDEVGRGPLAGPVTAAAVVLDRGRCRSKLTQKINDSKKLSRAHRDALVPEIRAVATIGLGWAGLEEIEELNILGATMLAMRRAFDALTKALGEVPSFALIDGNRNPKLGCPTKTVIKGDAISLSIAAASIIAKVARDDVMKELAKRFPGYGWERNAGYGTREHLEALHRLGPTSVHRRGFAPVRAALQSRESAI